MTVDRRSPEARLRRLRAWLGGVGWAVPGSVVPVTWRASGGHAWTYHVWNGKTKRWQTVSRMLPDEVVPMIRAAIRTDRRFRAAHRALRALSMRVIEAQRQQRLRRPPRPRHEQHR